MADHQELQKTTPHSEDAAAAAAAEQQPQQQVPALLDITTDDVPQPDKPTVTTTATPEPPPMAETEEEEEEEEKEESVKKTKPSTTVAEEQQQQQQSTSSTDSDPPKPSSQPPPPPPVAASDDAKIPESLSFKEETTKVSDLPPPHQKALQDLKLLVQEALNNHDFTSPPPPPPAAKEEVKPVAPPEPVTVAAAEEEKQQKQQQPTTEVEVESPASVVAPNSFDEMPDSEPVADLGETKNEPEKDPIADPAPHPQTEAVPVVVDEDGAKTVEAIEETIVAVSTATTKSVPPPPPVKEPEQPAVDPQSEAKETKTEPIVPEEVFIWGIKLLEDERSDVILLKFLRARDFKVKEAFTMLKNTIRWRKEFGIDQLMEEDLGDDLGKVVYMQGHSKEGHPVCYNVYGQFQNKELYQKTFSDEEKRLRFLRWRIQFLEKSIRNLDLSPGGISTIVQVNDLKNSPGPGKWELRQATKQALHLLQDNYPEFVAKQVFINVPWWYLAVNRMISPFLTQRTKSKFVFAGPSKSAETLFKYIAAEQVPVEYGGLSKDGDFGTEDAVTEITVKPSAKHTVEFPVTEGCLLSWEIRVVGWGVSYGAEFVPSSEEGYTVIIQKARRVASAEEPVVRNNFKIGEAGKVVLTIDNPTSKKKKLLYRLKTKSSSSTV